MKWVVFFLISYLFYCNCVWAQDKEKNLSKVAITWEAGYGINKLSDIFSDNHRTTAGNLTLTYGYNAGVSLFEKKIGKASVWRPVELSYGKYFTNGNGKLHSIALKTGLGIKLSRLGKHSNMIALLRVGGRYTDMDRHAVINRLMFFEYTLGAGVDYWGIARLDIVPTYTRFNGFSFFCLTTRWCLPL